MPLFFLFLWYNIAKEWSLIMTDKHKTITLAGGCFWGVEEYYKRLNGVLNTNVGYANGHTDGPVLYRDVCTGATGHAEAVWIEYNPTIISLQKLLEHLFRIIDPTSLNKQGGDIGTQYRTGAYYQSDEDYHQIREFIDHAQAESDTKIVVEVAPLRNYILAEPEHQDYLTVNPYGYCHVNFSVMKPEEMKPDYFK